MATKAARGTKRSCQNQECGARFYDLNREPIECPICGSGYVIAHQTMSAAAVAAAAAAEEKAARKAKKIADDAAADLAATAEGEEALADIEVAEEPIAAEGDETFLEEEEEEGGDVSNIIGGPVAEGGEEV